jgi:hypothetical protein
LQSEVLSGSYSYTVANAQAMLPDRIRALLRPYRYHRILNNQG